MTFHIQTTAPHYPPLDGTTDALALDAITNARYRRAGYPPMPTWGTPARRAFALDYCSEQPHARARILAWCRWELDYEDRAEDVIAAHYPGGDPAEGKDNV